MPIWVRFEIYKLDLRQVSEMIASLLSNPLKTEIQCDLTHIQVHQVKEISNRRSILFLFKSNYRVHSKGSAK